MIKKYLKKESGIALMIVLGAIALLTSVATEFAYNTNINYHLAANDKESTQAYFLANSAINLMKLELKLERDFRSRLSNSPAAQMVAGNMSAPLCQQFPLSTSLLRSMFLGETQPAVEEGEGAEEGSPAPFISGIQVEAAEEFLGFEGDFEGECQDESAKYNLNMFAGKKPEEETLSGLNSYDRAKQMLTSILSNPSYRKLFGEDYETKIPEVVRNIADWIDKNDRINELGGTSTGNESAVYQGGLTDYDVKNGKLLTLEEIHMISGIEDSWFLPIKDRFTIYGEEKLNVCVAPDDIVKSLILQYANTNATVPDVSPTDEKKIENLISIVKMGCSGANPSPSAIEQALNNAMGVTSPPGGANSFSNLITTDSRYYTLIGTGRVRDTEVRIRAVIDTRSPNPRRWDMVYWRVE